LYLLITSLCYLCYHIGTFDAVRQQENEISAFLDMGLVYGNSEAHLDAIKEITGKLYSLQDLDQYSSSKCYKLFSDTLLCLLHMDRIYLIRCWVLLS